MAREQVRRKAAAQAVEVGAGALVRDGERVEDDPWIVLGEDERAPEGADVVVSLARFVAEREALFARNNGRLGVLVDAGEAVEEIGADAARLGLVMVRFPAFRDGRGFTTARLLRERYGFKGELRAVGEVLEDQVFFMLRCGFDSFEIIASEPEAAFARAARTFSVVYQRAADAAVPALDQRSEKKNRVSRARRLALVREPQDEVRGHLEALAGASARDILAYALTAAWPGRFAIVSSFGVESAVMLHILASLDASAPVIFLETERHFAQTLQYKDELIARLGLTNVISQAPNGAEARAEDPAGDLWRRDPDACCALRKVRPLGEALAPYAAWATGRKRFHGGLRAQLQAVEHDGVHFKVNPLVEWRQDDIAAYMQEHDLPQHPLVAQGFPSIGCWPCTQPADSPGRSGRWAGIDKTECGIHVPASVRRRAF